jgi:uncharacterized protein
LPIKIYSCYSSFRDIRDKDFFMDKNQPPLPKITPIRRDEKAVKDPAWIEGFLSRAAYGVLATSQEDGPHAKPSLFVYEAGSRSIYLHGARDGQLYYALQIDPRVCFCVSEIGRLLPSDAAAKFGVEYASVILTGLASIIEDRDEARKALQLLLDKYFPHLRPGDNYLPMTVEEIDKTAVYRIRIEQWSGKRAQAPEI